MKKWMPNKTKLKIVEAETRTAQSMGISSTPSFLINGKPLIGAQPFDVFKQTIEAELSK